MDAPTSEATPQRRCEWCSALLSDGIGACRGCGATVPGASGDGEPYITGVTDVHPSLKAAAARPLHIPGNSPTQAVAMTAARMAGGGGIAGALLGLGAVAAVAAVEWMGAEQRAKPA